jgi:tetratricopeptide (TPR) repeat protein
MGFNKRFSSSNNHSTATPNKPFHSTEPPLMTARVAYQSKVMQTLKAFVQRLGGKPSVFPLLDDTLPLLPADSYRAEQASPPSFLAVANTSPSPLASHYGQLAYKALTKGDALRLRDQIEQALLQYTVALTHDAQLAEAHAGLGHCHRRQGDIPQAIVCFKRALAINPFLKFAQLDVAKCYNDLGNLPLAQKHYQTAIQLSPQWIEARFGLALILETQERFDQAIAQYTHILEADATFLPAIHNLGHIEYRMGNYPQAVAWFTKSLAVSPGFPRAILGLAMAQEKNGQLREALASYHWMVQVRPNSHQLSFLKQRMDYLHEVLGRPVKAATKQIVAKGQARRSPASLQPGDDKGDERVHLVRLK